MTVRSGGDEEKRLVTNLSEASSKQTVSVKQSEEVVGSGGKVLTRKKLLRKLQKEGRRRGQLLFDGIEGRRTANLEERFRLRFEERKVENCFGVGKIETR